MNTNNRLWTFILSHDYLDVDIEIYGTITKRHVRSHPLTLYSYQTDISENLPI